jgi:hypothetical protein
MWLSADYPEASSPFRTRWEYAPAMPRPPRNSSEPLPSHPSAGVVIGGILGGLDHLILKRPRPVTQIEEPYQQPWATLDGIVVEGLDKPVERPEPPDRSGARL